MLNLRGLSPVRGMFLCLWWIFGVGWIGCRRPALQGKQIFRYNQQEGIGTLDPAFARNLAIMWATH